jgi:inosine-uridine nucleoside N-ribohydrolase
MAHKVVLVADPGIDGAFAITLALYDPDIEVLGLAATGGNVPAEQASRNVQIVIEQLDPPRWPRIGSALSIEYDVDGTNLHGPGGLGNVEFPCAQLHHTLAADKLITDVVRQHPQEVTVIVMGPMTALARAIDRDPELPALVHRLVCIGGAWHEPGNISPVAEFHVYCDPPAARQVLRCGAPLTLIPLDVTRRIVLSPGDLLNLPAPESRACRFLRQIVPFGIGATSNLYGIEGFHLKDVLGIAAVALPGAMSTRAMPVDVEVRGELTRGMTVMDVRWARTARPNVDLAVGIDVQAVRNYMDRILRLTG